MLFAKVEIPWPWSRGDKYPRKTAGTPASPQQSSPRWVSRARWPWSVKKSPWLLVPKSGDSQTWADLRLLGLSNRQSAKSGNVLPLRSDNLLSSLWFLLSIRDSLLGDPRFQFIERRFIWCRLTPPHIGIYWFRDSLSPGQSFINPQSHIGAFLNYFEDRRLPWF